MNETVPSSLDFNEVLLVLHKASARGRIALHETVRTYLKQHYDVKRLTTVYEPDRDATYLFCREEVMFTPKKDFFASDPRIGTSVYLLLTTANLICELHAYAWSQIADIIPPCLGGLDMWMSPVMIAPVDASPDASVRLAMVSIRPRSYDTSQVLDTSVYTVSTPLRKTEFYRLESSKLTPAYVSWLLEVCLQASYTHVKEQVRSVLNLIPPQIFPKTHQRFADDWVPDSSIERICGHLTQLSVRLIQDNRKTDSNESSLLDQFRLLKTLIGEFKFRLIETPPFVDVAYGTYKEERAIRELASLIALGHANG